MSVTTEPENKVMGRVLTEVTVENIQDLLDSNRGLIPTAQVRRVTVPDALVDTGATSFGMPRSMIQQLGLAKISEKRATTASGPVAIPIHGPARITIQGQFMSIDVMEVPDGSPVLVGQIPLEMLDFVIDLQGRRLIANPAHGGEHMLELY
jgi:predicted aspartyl protease